MRRMNITTKIWLSVGVFALGFVLSTTLGQIQGLLAERELQRHVVRPVSGGPKVAGRAGGV